MILHQAKLGVGLATLGLAMVLATAAPASAVQFKAAKHHKTTHKSSHKTTTTVASKGSDPTGAYCTLGKQLKAQVLKGSNSEVQDIESGNWPALKKIVVAQFNTENKLLPEIERAFSGLPANVKAAEQVELKALPGEEKAIENMTSVAQFTSSTQVLEGTPQDQAAEKVDAAYEEATCGTPGS
jgi:hypothetical protein